MNTIELKNPACGCISHACSAEVLGEVAEGDGVCLAALCCL